MLWNILLGYVVLCELTVLGFTLFGLFSEDCENLQEVKPPSRHSTLAARFAIGVLLAPIYAPLLLYASRVCWQQMQSELDYWKSVRRQHQDLILDRVHECNVPEELAAHFTLQSPSLVTLNYVRLGDFWLKSEPFHSMARLFLHPDDTAFAEIGRTLDTLYCEMISFLEDGSVVSTAVCDPIEDSDVFAEHGYHLQCCPGLEMAELTTVHEQFLQTTTAAKGIAVRRICRHQWKEYYRYHNRRFGQIKFEIGEADEPVPCEFPQLTTTKRWSENAADEASQTQCIS